MEQFFQFATDRPLSQTDNRTNSDEPTRKHNETQKAVEADRDHPWAPFVAEFVGTFILVFTFGNSDRADGWVSQGKSMDFFFFAFVYTFASCCCCFFVLILVVAASCACGCACCCCCFLFLFLLWLFAFIIGFVCDRICWCGF